MELLGGGTLVLDLSRAEDAGCSEPSRRGHEGNHGQARETSPPSETGSRGGVRASGAQQIGAQPFTNLIYGWKSLFVRMFSHVNGSSRS